MKKRMWAAVAVLVAALAVPAAGVTKTTRRHAEHDRLGGLHRSGSG